MHVNNSLRGVPNVSHLCEQSACEEAATDGVTAQTPPLLVTKPQRLPLHTLENITKNSAQISTSQKNDKALQTNPARKNANTSSSNVSPCPGASCYSCTRLRQEAVLRQCCVTNTLHFPSEESLHNLGVRMGTTEMPIMADQMTGVDLSHISRHDSLESATPERGLSVPPAAPTYHVRSSIVPVPSVRDTVQEAENPKLAPLFLSPAIQSLPNLRATTPNVNKAPPQHGGRSVSSLPPLASSADEISFSSVSDTHCCDLTGAPLALHNEAIPLDCPDTSLALPSSICSDENRKEQPSPSRTALVASDLPPPSSRAPVSPRCGTDTRPHVHRRRKRARHKPLWPLSTRTGTPDGLAIGGETYVSESGGKVAPTVPATKTDVAAVLPSSVRRKGGVPNLKNKRKMSDSGFVVSPENTSSRVSHDPFNSTDGKTADHRQSWEQIVPEGAIPLPQNGSPAYHVRFLLTHTFIPEILEDIIVCMYMYVHTH